jgi:hypothetical protein
MLPTLLYRLYFTDFTDYFTLPTIFRFTLPAFTFTDYFGNNSQSILPTLFSGNFVLTDYYYFTLLYFTDLGLKEFLRTITLPTLPTFNLATFKIVHRNNTALEPDDKLVQT